MSYILATLLLWVVLILYWIISAITRSRTDLRTEFVPLLKLVASALIVYLPLLTGKWLALGFYYPNRWTNIIGLTVCALGVALAIWARRTLGRNWSGRVMVQQEHHLIEEGPYRFIRHPIYAGVLLSMLGSALVVGCVFSFAYLLLSVFGLFRKSRQEETLLTRQFPDNYPGYMQRTKMFIPYLF